MKTPKLLPWHARRAGVSEDRARTLWRKAVRQATERSERVASAEYWAETMHSYLELLEAEQSGHHAPRLIPLLRSHNRIMRLPLTAIEDIYSAALARWKHHRPTSDKAA